MKNKKIYEDLSSILRKTKTTHISVHIVFVVLVLFFWKIQILDHQKYWEKSEANRIREIILPPQRGLIKDRNGKILAKNVASYKASIIRENCKNFEESCQKIARLLNLEIDVLKERIDKYKSLPRFRPIVIKDNLTLKEDVARIESRQLELPELVIQAEPKRFYPHGTLAAHVIGYLQELSQREIEADEHKERRQGDQVGKTGIEKEYEAQLVGTEGQLIEIVDSLGRSKGEISRREPVPGQDVWLTLDFDLQKKAEELLEGKEGVIVVLDARTGEILTLASYPNFDPNKFINRFTPKEWLDLVNSPKFPLENRAIRGLYSPGSIFKPTLALGALDSSIITDKTRFFCSGSIKIYGHPFSCWFKPGHGSVNLYEAIQHSCNIYFYQLGKKMGIEEIARYAKLLAFGSKTGIDLPGEKEGLVPDPIWKRRVKNAPWYPGETISVSIGQGPILVTPLQVATYTAIIANKGSRITPHLFKGKTHFPKGREWQSHPGERNPLKIKNSSYEKVIRGMWKAVNEQGTGRAARIEGFNVCGKTGSTQLVSTKGAKKIAQEKIEIKTHSWFTGFAPREDPKVIVTVLVEYGGMGGVTAAPLARDLFSLYRKKYDR